MKRLVCFLLLIGLPFSMVGCAKKATTITPAPEVLAFQESRKGMQPSPDALYDNETSVKDLPLRSAERVKGDSMWGEVGSLGYMSSNHTYEEQKNAGLGGVIRYNLGIYYAITPLDDGTYLVVRYSGGSLYRAEQCYLLSELNDPSFRECVALGMNSKAINMRAKGEHYREVLQEENGRNISFAHGFYYFSDLTCLGVTYDWQENQLKASYVGLSSPENCILSYLLPQDLELLV